jgi:hypothetical protein
VTYVEKIEISFLVRHFYRLQFRFQIVLTNEWILPESVAEQEFPSLCQSKKMRKRKKQEKYRKELLRCKLNYTVTEKVACQLYMALVGLLLAEH